MCVLVEYWTSYLGQALGFDFWPSPPKTAKQQLSFTVISSRSINVSRIKIVLNSGLTSLGLSLLNVGPVILHYSISFAMLFRFFYCCSHSLIFHLSSVGMLEITRSLFPIN